jgi:hypothetical protein
MIDLQPLPRVGVGEGEAAFCRRSSSDIPDDIQQDAVPELALRVAVTLNGGRARPNLIATKTAPTGNQNFVGGVPSASSQGCLHGATLVGMYSPSLRQSPTMLSPLSTSSTIFARRSSLGERPGARLQKLHHNARFGNRHAGSSTHACKH